ncbi:MAG: glycosyltransferase family 9 protein [FCB group bacterium]|jgi:ADP-heptose:LPS heptosyltransferase|nr:glycosyltransferase family 9 protein [FCB group bacterium]
MKILITQLMRMGDVLQSTPLFRALRHQYPGATIDVLARNLGRMVLERNPDINGITVYDEDRMFQDMKSQDADKLLDAYEIADGYIRGIREGGYDRVYNITHSIASAMLLKLAGVPEVVGAHLSDDWRFVLRGGWTNYFFTSVLHRDYNALNFCDITRNFADPSPLRPKVVFDVRDEDRQFIDALLAENGIGQNDTLVCLQLGASEERKRWPVDYFATLSKELVERFGARLFLAGVEREAHLGEAFQRRSAVPAVPLFGKTTLPQLAALLERCSVLVTNDTGTMHVAAAVECPVALVSVGYVHFRETGPYGSGHCAIEARREHLGRVDDPHGRVDRHTIRPEHVLKAVELLMQSDAYDPVPQIVDSHSFSAVELHMSRFAPDGCLEWYPVLRRPMTLTNMLRMAYRAMWLETFGHNTSDRAEKESLASLLWHHSPGGDAQIESWRLELQAVFDKLTETARHGVMLTEELLAMLRGGKITRRARELVAEMVRLDEDIRIFGELHDACKPLVMIARFERDNLEGADPMHLAEATLRIYRDLLDRAQLVRAKVDRIADLWQEVHG